MRARTSISIALALLVTLLAFVGLLIALGSSSPVWTPALAYTNSTLICNWTLSADVTAQNITLLKSGAYYNSTYENASLGPLSASLSVAPSYTTRGETWTCRITTFNSTVSETHDADVTILNSQPTTTGYPAGIFNASNQDVGYLVQIREDTTLLLDVNATDADNDALSYLPGDVFCTRTSSTLGTYACSPTQANLVGNLPTLVNISFIATDGFDPSGRTITFNVTPSNDPPVAVVSARTTPVNLSLNYTFSVADEETNTPYTVTLTAPAEIANKLTITPLNAQGSSVSIYYDATVPDFSDIGLWAINVTVTDTYVDAGGANASVNATYNFTLNITPVGRQPYFTGVTPAGPYAISQGQFLQINLSANDPDANSTLLFLPGTSRFAAATLKADTNSSDALGQINFTPTNADVGVYNVTLTVRDATTLTNTTILQFNVANVNDPPVLHEMSYSAANTQGNTNASNLTSYANTPFTYYPNATDPDLLYSEALTYTSNSTLFTINTTTGRISFTPNDTVVAPSYSINVTVTDLGGLSASRVLTLAVLANSPPYFNATLAHLNCTTNSLCAFDVAAVAEDPNPGDSVFAYDVAFVGQNIPSFRYNETTGLINFTTVKTDVGNYTLNVSITDTHGATNWTLMNLTINNTPEAPNLTRFDFGSAVIVETHLFTFDLWAQDEDFLLPAAAENVTFSTNLSLNHTLTVLSRTNTTARAVLAFTPDLGTNGTYTVQINATDRLGLRASKNVTFTIYPKALPPQILTFTPWGADTPAHEIQTTYANANDSRFTGNTAIVGLNENTNVLFNTTVSDPRPVTYEWKVNGTLVSTSESYMRAFDYFSAGSYVVRLNVSNDRYESTVWTWNLVVDGVNRAPVLVSPLDRPEPVNGTITYASYFTVGNGTKFIDYDDDLDSSGAIDGNETSTLVFRAASVCPVATLTITGSRLSITGTAVGGCTVVFNATDTAGAATQSNAVEINVTDIPQGSSPTPTQVSSGGGGSSSTSSTFIPITKKTVTPKAFSIIAPKLVTIYSNKTVEIPIIINNTWTTSLKMVQLAVLTNATGVTASFDTDLFEEIPANQSREVTLTVSNYRLGSNYEVLVSGNVTAPAYTDSALILLNSIEQANDGNDVEVKVTFANDLLNQHPECQELNEILEQAKEKIADGNIKEGGVLVDSVINGCKYLVSTQQRIQEKPAKLNPIINIDDLSLKAIMLGVLAFVVLSSISFLIYYHYTHKPEDDI